ncbi:MAG TPA: PAS domain S-box protein [Oculatellaceae cyanobacterium]
MNVQKFDQRIENIQQRLSDCQQFISQIRSQPIEPEISAVDLATILTELQTLTAELQQQHQPLRNELLDSEQEFRKMTETAPVMIWMSRTDALRYYFNQPWLEFTGRTLKQELGNGWTQGVHPEDFQRYLDIYLSAFNQRQKFKMEYRLRRTDGEYRWILDTGVPRFDTNGNFIGYIGSCVDINYHQQIELELLQRENYLAALVEVQRLLLIHPNCQDCYSQILEILGKIAGASRTYLFENYLDAADNLLMSQRAEWCAEGIKPEIDNEKLQNLSYDEFFPRWAKALTLGEIIAGIVTEFPDSERLILEPQGILSILILPLIVNGNFFGFVGFDNCLEARAWKPSEVDLLQAAAAAICLAQERHHIEKAWQESENRFRATFEQAGVGIAHIGINGQWLRVNQKLCEIVGYTYQELRELTFQDITFLEDLDLDLKYFRQMLTNEISNYSIEKRYVCKNHSIIWINLTVSLVRSPSGKPEYFISVVEDISDRRQTEEALKLSQQRLQLIMNSIPQGIFWKDKNSVYLGCNYNFAIDVGLIAPEEIAGKTDYELCFTQEEAEFSRQVDQRVIETKRPQYHIIKTHIQADGRHAWIETNKIPLHDPEGNIIGVLGTYEDITQRKQTEEALRQSEQRYRQMFENNQALKLLIDPASGKIVDANPAAAKFYGYQLEYLKQLKITDINILLEEQVAVEMQNALSERRSYFLFRHKLADGEIRDVEVYSSPIYIQGKILLYSIIHDITERRRAETALQQAKDELEIRVVERTAELRESIVQLSQEIAEREKVEAALRESEARFRLLAENSTDMISRHTPDGTYLYVSPACYTLIGYQPEDLVGVMSYELFHPDDLAAIARIHEYTLNQPDVYTISYRIRHQDGRYIWFESTVRSVWDETGIIEIHVASRDITQRQQAQETSTMLATAVEQAADAIEITDAQARFQYVNPAFEKLTGYTLAEVQQQTPATFLRGEDNDAFYQMIWDTVSSGQVWTGTMIGKRKDGSVYDQEATISPVHSSTGVITNYVAVKRDITERKRVEAQMQKALEQARELSELKSRFVSMTSHEFRTPLTIMLSSANLLQLYRYKWTEEKKLIHFQRIQIAGQRMTDLLNDILLLGKADADKLESHPHPINLVQFCREIIADLELTDNAQHPITFISPDTDADACMDQNLLQRILSNLLSNALKYSPVGSKVLFQLSYENQTAVFQVQDYGIGIPLADQQGLFESFQRASNVGTIPGSGLGLAIVKKCVDLQGGEIAISSEAGVGTQITVSLPLWQ